jgi:hypothetical protein
VSFDPKTINTETAREHLRLEYTAFGIAGLADPDETREPVSEAAVLMAFFQAKALLEGDQPAKLLCPQSVEVVDRDGNERWINVDDASPAELQEMIANTATRAALLTQAADELARDLAALIAVSQGVKLVARP